MNMSLDKYKKAFEDIMQKAWHDDINQDYQMFRTSYDTSHGLVKYIIGVSMTHHEDENGNDKRIGYLLFSTSIEDDMNYRTINTEEFKKLGYCPSYLWYQFDIENEDNNENNKSNKNNKAPNTYVSEVANKISDWNDDKSKKINYDYYVRSGDYGYQTVYRFDSKESVDRLINWWNQLEIKRA